MTINVSLLTMLSLIFVLPLISCVLLVMARVAGSKRPKTRIAFALAGSLGWVVTLVAYLGAWIALSASHLNPNDAGAGVGFGLVVLAAVYAGELYATSQYYV